MEENLIEGLQREIKRNKMILGYYEEIPEGAFGASMIKMTISRGEKALVSDDVVEMLRAFRDLEHTKE